MRDVAEVAARLAQAQALAGKLRAAMASRGCCPSLMPPTWCSYCAKVSLPPRPSWQNSLNSLQARLAFCWPRAIRLLRWRC